MIDWMEKHNYPFSFLAEASINLADDPALMALMREAGFNNVFVGIETPSEESLKECNKVNNVNRNLIAAVKSIQNYGMEVSAGFIVGFDSDTPSIFERQISFIQQSGIVNAMVGLLNAPRGTRLFERLKQEKRCCPSFPPATPISDRLHPQVNPQKLAEGYRSIVTTIYGPRHLLRASVHIFQGVQADQAEGGRRALPVGLHQSPAAGDVIPGHPGESGRSHYWKLLFKTTFRYRRFLPNAVIFSVNGFHYRKIFGQMPLRSGDHKLPGS